MPVDLHLARCHFSNGLSAMLDASYRARLESGRGNVAWSHPLWDWETGVPNYLTVLFSRALRNTHRNAPTELKMRKRNIYPRVNDRGVRM